MPSRLPGRTSSRITCPRLSTRQGAKAFNQALSFDTSKVTDMSQMFSVRSAHALSPQSLESDPLFVHVACPHASRAVPRPASHARLSTLQGASAFNQELSFDTSKVTTMEYMLMVRSARALLGCSLESG